MHTNTGLDDPRYAEAVKIVKEENRASPSFLQRKLLVGYNRAARMIEQMESDGVISSASYSGARTVISAETK